MSPERPFGDSGTEHRTDPDHPRQTEEATAVALTPNRFWRMMIDPGFFSPASNLVSLTVTTEAFLGLTSQIQALAGMVQTIIPYLPQLMHSMAHQSAPPAAPPQTESLMAPNRGIPPDLEAPPPRVAEVRPASSTPTLARSQSRSYNPASTELDLDTLSIDFTDSLREQVRRIQSKPLSATFRLPALEPYDGSGDPTEHIVTFRAQMALYDTSEALMFELFGKRTPEANHGLTPRDGPRERRAPLLVRRTVHIAGPGNLRPPSIPGHPSIPDGAEAVKVFLVADRATTDGPALDATTGALVYGGRDANSWQAG
ncbi:hypothetical protein BHM03_00024466 [Ensete ventricosum]|nr:hypothetical protein BHM03_00024466 [Ensete ventricosum]